MARPSFCYLSPTASLAQAKTTFLNAYPPIVMELQKVLVVIIGIAIVTEACSIDQKVKEEHKHQQVYIPDDSSIYESMSLEDLESEIKAHFEARKLFDQFIELSRSGIYHEDDSIELRAHILAEHYMHQAMTLSGQNLSDIDYYIAERQKESYSK